MEKRYPEYYGRLKGLMGKLGKELEGPMAAFGQMHKQVFPDGALTTKTKELITLAICITSLCEGCIAVHVRAALRALFPSERGGIAGRGAARRATFGPGFPFGRSHRAGERSHHAGPPE